MHTTCIQAPELVQFVALLPHSAQYTMLYHTTCTPHGTPHGTQAPELVQFEALPSGPHVLDSAELAAQEVTVEVCTTAGITAGR